MKPLRNITLTIAGAVLVIGLTGCSDTLEDCILDSMEKAQTREAAVFMRKACERKHKRTLASIHASRPISAEEFLGSK